ncbi:LPS export ABC transporter permease LptG [Desulfosarcina alkanivorans]|uniref:LPS export ABC transporter permease LptG n=1 Tax=Desulfosarcina alkanivorans TaxID=571177 RepID=A0A5K7YDE3_9BACT|nr:LPS export ABC transporter permease LptG [Desulfosarcina alkanivorans]BBO67502.1 LPS export ABC transporter permease LptG [Desulfosarcina alkanivorans]
MTILYRYVTREILICFSIVLVAVLSIYLAVDFIEKIDNFMEAGVSASRCVVYLLYKLPFILVQIAPVGFLLSILVALGLMSKNNEVIALKSCGIGKTRLLKPALVLGLVFGCLLFVVAEMLAPVFMVKANQIWLQEVKKKNIFASKTNDIWMRASRQIIHIKSYQPDKKRISRIAMHTFDDQFRLINRIDAQSGEFINGQWRLKDVVEQAFDENDGGHQLRSLDTLTVEIDLNPDDLARAAKRSDEMGLAELGRYIEKVEREGYGAVRFRVDYHGKIAAPFVCLFLSVLGTGIALRGKLREGMPVSITYGLGIAFLYWIFNSFCLSLGYAEMMPPVVAAWVANIVFFSVAGFLILNAH